MSEVRIERGRRTDRMTWIKAPAAPRAFLDELPSDIHPLVGQLLWNRGITDPSDCRGVPAG